MTRSSVTERGLRYSTNASESSPPAAPRLSIAIGIVLFNNATAELADLARTLHRAIARLVESEARANPPRATMFSIRMHNNGDAPSDPSPFGPHARLTRSPANLGFGCAHNLLMREAFAGDAKAEFYLAVNPDGLLHPDALVEMIAAARRWEGRALVEAAQFPEEHSKIFDPLTLDTPWASGACLLVPAAVYAAIGGFDENIFMFCEDVDLSWRARQAGYAVKHAPRALFHHRWNRPGTNKVTQRAHLDAARYLATKWGAEEFAREIERTMLAEKWEPNALPSSPSAPLLSSVVDFKYGLYFAPARWAVSGAIPAHTVTRHVDVDNSIDVVVRFHDPGEIRRLSRCLFSLYGQLHQPIQVLLMLQSFDDEGARAVEACVDALDWSSPRRRPIVSNVAVPPTGDHRSRLWNAGLDLGRARYLGFCDFDDVVYSAGYGYLLRRLQYTGAAATFASVCQVDCTPMDGFDFAFAREFLPGEDRYDFFVNGFCPVNGVLFDRSRLQPDDLRADENVSKFEDYRAFAPIAAKYDTDWACIGTAVGEYIQRTDGSNTILAWRTDKASRREWDASSVDTHQFVATLTAKVPVSDIVRMRSAVLDLRRELNATQVALAQLSDERTNIMKSLSWRLTSPLRKVRSIVERLRMPRRSQE